MMHDDTAGPRSTHSDTDGNALEENWHQSKRHGGAWSDKIPTASLRTVAKHPDLSVK